jgi:hypothetical protein
MENDWQLHVERLKYKKSEDQPDSGRFAMMSVKVLGAKL